MGGTAGGTLLTIDGTNFGEKPVRANCTFPEGEVTFGDKIMVDVNTCGNTSHCFKKNFTYDDEMFSQMKNVIAHSSTCFQAWTFECTSASLKHPVSFE